jgi:hypothetical protein
MLKVRYSKLRLPLSIAEFAEKCARWRPKEKGARLRVASRSDRDVVLNHVAVRLVTVSDFTEDGTQVKRTVPSLEQHQFRIFKGRSDIYLAVLNPGRGVKAVESLMDSVLSGDQYFIEPLEITTELIEKHVRQFTSARLVSAKIRDFKVSDTAVGRLEIVSKGGLPDEIAPFLKGKYYRIDALTYEITHDLTQGLVWYSSGGTVRMSGPVAEVAFPVFERQL